MVSKANNSFSRVWTFVNMLKNIFKIKIPSMLMHKYGQLSGTLQQILQLCNNILYAVVYRE